MAVSAFFNVNGAGGRPLFALFQIDGRTAGSTHPGMGGPAPSSSDVVSTPAPLAPGALADMGVRDPSSGNFVSTPVTVPLGAMVVMDFRSIAGGWICWKPYDDSGIRPLPYAAADAIRAVGPSPGQGHSLVVRLPVFLQQHG